MNMLHKNIIIITLAILLLPTIVFAHKGKTDSNGGHTNRTTGEYHYHHGYSEHPHINGICPYEASLDEWLPSVCPQCSSSINSQNGLYCFECGYNLSEKYNINLFYAVDGPSSKTRKEYYEEVRTLEEKIDELKQKQSKLLDSKQIDLEEKQKEIENLKQSQINHNTFFIFINILIAIIFYKLGKIKNR